MSTRTAPSNEGETLNGSSHSISDRVRTSDEKEKAPADYPTAVVDDNEEDYPHGLKLGLLTLALCLSVFLVALVRVCEKNSRTLTDILPFHRITL